MHIISILHFYGQTLINEPTAAAISYLYENPTLKGKVSLVFDLGGGTFDVSIVRIEEGKDNEVLASDGDSFLGGRDWDKLIGDYFIERFCEETGYDYHTAINDSSFKAFAMSCAEKHKRYLSDMSKTRVSFERYGKHCSFDFTRNEFDEKTSGLLQSAIIKARGVIEKAKAKCSDFNDKDMEILMVGGSTLMPQIREMLEKEFGIIPKLYRPHEAVARGALLYACQIMKNNRGGGELYLGGNEQSNKLGDLILGGAIYDVSSKGYGIRLVRSEDDEIGYVKNLIPKNERLPFDPGTGREDEKGENHCCTVVGNQTAIIFEIYENDEMSYGNDIDIDECTYIGEMKITGLPERRPAGMPCTVFMKLGTDGILYASGRDDSTGKHCNAEIKISGVISESEISNAKSIVDSFVIQ